MKRFTDETFYTPEQVANKLQLSLTTVYNLIKSKDIPAIRIGKCFRIPESELAQLIRIRNPIIPQSAIAFVNKLKKSNLNKKIVDVVLFGSYARGNPDEDSDIDLLVIQKDLTSKEKEQLIIIEDEASEEDGYLDYMNVIKKSVLQWRILENQNSNLYKVISREGISLWKS